MSQANVNGTRQAARAPPAMDLERPSLTQPWRMFLSRGFILDVAIQMTPTGTNVLCTVDPAVLGTKESKVSAGIARQAIIDKGLWAPGKPKGAKSDTKNKEELPKKSICKKDFEGNDASLFNRARSVANTIGDTTARGRIGSMGLTRKGKATFEDWWKGAGGKRKARLLTDKKHFLTLTDDDLSRLDKLMPECPFRGPVPTEEKESAPPKKNGSRKEE